ncbi:MAG: TVP38/TMEM64 family protein [Clostridiales bacterium]|nr:TVP38/TMEM64 family protein [Clostridiales bacterium]
MSTQPQPRNSQKHKLKIVLRIFLGIFAIAVIAIVTVLITPTILSFRNEETRQKFIEYIDGFGIWGVVVMMAIQVSQVLISIIPGEPVEVLCGMMYGAFWGMILCLAGITAASALIFAGVRKFGIKFVNRFTNSEKFEKLKFLHDSVKRDVLLFVLFLIPGTPKDTLVYFAPFTKIKLSRFLVITTFARIPSVLSSTYAGSNISQGNFLVTVIVLIVTAVFGAAGIYINGKIIKGGNASYQKDKSK